MKRAMWVLVISSLAFFGAAPKADALSMHLGVEGDFSLPLSDWGDAAGVGIGGMAKFELFPIDSVGVGFRAGYIYHLSKDIPGIGSTNASEIPFILSGKYKTSFGLYGELGFGMFINGVSSDAESNSKTKFGFLVGAGFQFSSIYFSANFYSPSMGDMGDGVMGLLFNVGWNFLNF